MFKKKLSGVHAPHLKNTSDMKAQRIPVPKIITVPMSMHIGAPAKPVVKRGDEVKVGQLIAESGGFVSAPIFSGASGKVKKIDTVQLSNGNKAQAIVIESDGKQEEYEGLCPPKLETYEDFTAAARNCGLVGLGGAGFPTAVKLTVKDLSKVDTVIVNGAECEPYITSDTRTMLDDTELVWQGMNFLKKQLQVEKVIIGIEDNKLECISKFKKLCKDANGMETHALPSLYPQGGEKVLIYNTTGRIVPEGKLPLDVGVIVINCTTLACFAKYINTGMPLVEKTVTVDGSAIKDPKNVIAPIGTPIKDLVDFCGGFKGEPAKVLYGGPMMGIAIPDITLPIMKNTNAITAFSEENSTLPEETACIRCGRCVAHCPLHLSPVNIATAFENNDVDGLAKLKVNLCMECGCCSYVCPANRHLVQTNKLAKAQLRTYQKLAADKKKAEEAKKKEENK